jgi:predicted Zn-dependent peptidase
MPPNPFAGFESFRLPNGMKVWYRQAPRAAVSTMVLIVPFGRDQDAPGKEQTAHLLEHVLLSDRDGHSEAELIRELTARGGSFSGVTGPHYTLFPVSVESAHAAFGVEWLHGVIAPRPFSDDLVVRSRGPVIVEMEGRQRTLLRGPVRRLLDDPRLRPRAFWAREFGYPAHEERGADELSSLLRVSALDLRRYYDTYYAPSAMTLVIVAAAPLVDLQPVIERTFGTLPWRPVPPQLEATRPRDAASRRFVHTTSKGTSLTLSYRIAAVDGRDQLRLAFIEDLLRMRLTERLRGGDVKSVYDVRTTTEIRGGAAYFAILVDMYPRHEKHVREAVDLEIGRLQRASADTTAFYADRDVVARMLRLEHASPGALRAWAMRWTARTDLHEDFPDAGHYYATVGADSIAAFAARTFVARQRITSIARPLPLHPFLLLLLGSAAMAAAVLLYRRMVLRDADMADVRFVAHLTPPLITRISTGALIAAALLVSARLAGAAVHVAAERWILPLDSFLLAGAVAGMLIAGSTLAAIAGVGMLHAKVLVFGDRVMLKSPTYRAVSIPAAEIRRAWPAADVPTPRLRRPAPGPRARAVLLELRDGSGYILHVRHPDRLMRAVNRLLRPSALASVGLAEGVEETPHPALT